MSAGGKVRVGVCCVCGERGGGRYGGGKAERVCRFQRVHWHGPDVCTRARMYVCVCVWGGVSYRCLGTGATWSGRPCTRSTRTARGLCPVAPPPPPPHQRSVPEHPTTHIALACFPPYLSPLPPPFFCAPAPCSRNNFERAQTDVFEVQAAVGEPKYLRIGHDNAGLGASWHLQEVVLSNPGMADMQFVANRWVAWMFKPQRRERQAGG